MFKLMSCIALMLLSLMAAANGYADTSIINEYDANGNLVTGDGKYYEYNDANKLVKVRQGVDQTGPVIAEYFYDFSGQRVKKIENGVVTYYVGKHFEKQVGGANEGNTSYYFGDGGERVAKKDPAGNIFYYHLDHLDGVNVVTDSAGTVVAKTDYLPFGDVRAGSSGSEKYSYTGKEKDKTDLYYFDARYNSPEFRHFTQADLAEPDFADPQDLNRYSYVGNNPLSYIDPDGFKKKKKKHLSKRERRAIALGLNPDKDKYKVGKMSNREYKRALEAHRKSKPAASRASSTSSAASSSSSNYSAASSSRYQLAGGGSAGGNRYASIGDMFTNPYSNTCSRYPLTTSSSKDPQRNPEDIVLGSGKTVSGLAEWGGGVAVSVPGLSIAAGGIVLCTSVVGCVATVPTVAYGLAIASPGIAAMVKGGFDTLEGVGDIYHGFTGKDSPFDNPLDFGEVPSPW